jgi:hypothetical protein
VSYNGSRGQVPEPLFHDTPFDESEWRALYDILRQVNQPKAELMRVQYEAVRTAYQHYVSARAEERDAYAIQRAADEAYNREVALQRQAVEAQMREARERWRPTLTELRTALEQARLEAYLRAGEAGLNLRGGAFLGLLRNSLADPYIVGVSSGAAVGAAVGVLLGWHMRGWGWAIALLAFGSGLLTLMLALGLSRQGGQLRVPSFLLVGVSLSASLWGVITLLLVLAGEDLSRVLYWLLGGLLNADWTRLGWACAPALVGCGLLVAQARAEPLHGGRGDRAALRRAGGAAQVGSADWRSAGDRRDSGDCGHHRIRRVDDPAPAAPLGGGRSPRADAALCAGRRNPAAVGGHARSHAGAPCRVARRRDYRADWRAALSVGHAGRGAESLSSVRADQVRCPPQ